VSATDTAPARRPALLTIDDDPAVSAAVARDLRARYGEHYRIVRADSGAGALDALRRLKLRGDRVAALLADHRMPEMDGVEFLRQAKALFPRAKKVLLTAYADTDAAIAAINDVDLDHYLLKPWDPPEEQLYPVVDDLLEDWAASDKPPFEGVRVLGHRWSAPSHRVKDFLARNQVPYRWIDGETDAEAERLLAAAGLDGATPDQLPVVFLADGTALRAPTNLQLAEHVGLATTAELPFYDLVIVGAGPAGLAAAVYGASEGLRTVLVERQAPGGQAGQSSRIENYLGFPHGLSGADLARRATDQARRLGAELVTVSEVCGIAARGSARVVTLSDGRELAAHAVLVTTGVDYTRLPAPGVDEFSGRGVYYGAAVTEALSCTDDDVYIVGAANSAGQAAVYFAASARSVTLLVRGDALEKSMSAYLVEQIRALPNVRVRLNTEVVEGRGGDHLEGITVLDRVSGAREQLATNWLFVFIGASPRTDWLDGLVVRDRRGFVLTGPDLVTDGRPPAGWPLEREPLSLETSVPGVFAAGDVRRESVKRVASAVGEGAMAVTQIHRYLEKL